MLKSSSQHVDRQTSLIKLGWGKAYCPISSCMFHAKSHRPTSLLLGNKWFFHYYWMCIQKCSKPKMFMHEEQSFEDRQLNSQPNWESTSSWCILELVLTLEEVQGFWVRRVFPSSGGVMHLQSRTAILGSEMFKITNIRRLWKKAVLAQWYCESITLEHRHEDG